MTVVLRDFFLKLRFYIMRYIIFLLPLLSCYSVEKDCDSFKLGNFEFTTIVNGEIKTSRFERSKSLEIEFYENKIDSATVKWVNDCEFILTKINPKSNQDKRPVKIEILSTEGKEYFFEYSLVSNPAKRFRGRAIKIN